MVFGRTAALEPGRRGAARVDGRLSHPMRAGVIGPVPMLVYHGHMLMRMVVHMDMMMRISLIRCGPLWPPLYPPQLV